MRPLRFAAAFVLALSCHEALQPAPAAPPPTFHLVDNSRPTKSFDAIQPSDAAAAVNATYRPTPDRRFLMATADIYELSTGHAPADVTIDFRDDRWIVRCGGEEAGSLPEIPTFADGLDFLTRWAQKLATRRTAAAPLAANTAAGIDARIVDFTPPQLFAAIDAIAKATKGSTLAADSAPRAAHATTQLAAQLYDSFTLGDPLLARAMALTALARRTDSRACAEDVALLARLFGYLTEAGEMSRALPATSFASAYINSVPAGAPATPAFQWLRTNVALHDEHAATALDVQYAPLLLNNPSFEDALAISAGVRAIILREVESNRFLTGSLTIDESGGWMGAYPQRKGDAERFEAVLPARVTALETSILNAASVRAWYEANFFAAANHGFSHASDSLGSGPASHAFVESLGKPQAGAGAQVVEWMSQTTTAEFDGAAKVPNLPEMLRGMSVIGGCRRSTLLQTVFNGFGSAQPAVVQAARETYPALDTRPCELDAAGTISWRIAGDPMRRDRYIPLALARNPNVEGFAGRAYYALIVGDREALRKMIDDNALAANERGIALGYLTTISEMDDAYARRKFDELINASNRIEVFSQYAQYLNRRGDANGKERVMRAQLAKHKDGDPFVASWLAYSLSNALERQGRYREAQDVLGPHLSTWTAYVIGEEVSLLQRLGKDAEAHELGEQMIGRYPDANSRSLVAAVLWRERRFADAAELFSPRHPYPQAAGSLPEDLAKLDDSDAVAAFGALIDAKADQGVLEAIPAYLIDKPKKAQLAFTLAERIADRGGTALITAYKALKAWKGPEAAAAWTIERVPAASKVQAAVFFYGYGHYELVERLATAPTDEMQTLRGASLLMQRVPSTDPRWQSFVATLRGLPDAEKNFPIACYLAGITDEKTYFATVARGLPKERSLADYFAGVKAFAARDYARALPLMIAAANGPPLTAPTGWGQAMLYRWAAERATWSDIAARGL